MVYHHVTLGPSDGQMSDLAEGRQVLMAHGDFQGEVSFHLTTDQKTRIQKAFAAGKGCKLRLSAAQVKMMAQKGSGRFSDYLRSGYDFMKPSLRAGLKKGRQHAEKQVSNVLTAAEKRIAAAAGLEGKGFFGNIARKVAHSGVDLIADQLGGAVAVPKGRKGPAVQAGAGWLDFLGGSAKPKQGKGFFGNIAKKVAHGGVDLIADQLGGAVPNPLANPNEGLARAMFQKKVGAGLRM